MSNLLVKSFFFLFLSVLATGFEIPEDIRQSIEKLHKHCIAKTGASIEHIHKCSDKEIPNDPDAKCYMACMHENHDVDLEARNVEIQHVNHEINDDIHGLVEDIRKQCKDEEFGKCPGFLR